MALGDPRAPDTDALLYHPEVVRVIRAVLLEFGIRDQELEDGIHEVITKTLESVPKDKRPTTVQGWKPLVRKISYTHACSVLRKIYARGKTNIGPTDGADDHAAPQQSSLEPHERAQIRAIVEEFRQKGGAGKHTELILAALMTDAPPREAAEEARIPQGQMRKQMSKTRKLLRNKFVQMGLGGIVLLLTWEGVEVYNANMEEKAMVHFFLHSADPVVDKHDEPPRFRDLPGIDKAPAYREKAAAECAKQDWGGCAGDLDMARYYDPAGEKLPEVQELRHQLFLNFSAKPRYPR